MSQPSYVIVLCTCADASVALNLARRLVDTRLAACVNILPGVTSVYAWEDKVESSAEHLLVIKTEAELFFGVQEFIKQNHSYELPEVIAVPILHGLPDYLKWISAWVISDSSGSCSSG